VPDELLMRLGSGVAAGRGISDWLADVCKEDRFGKVFGDVSGQVVFSSVAE
jgi:hypothetical protein